MNDSKKKDKFDLLFEQVERYPSLEKLQLYRNMNFGAGAACLVLISQLASMGPSSEWLKASLLAAAVSMPLWLCLGGLLEYYIMLGPKSYPHKRTAIANGLIGGLTLFAGLGLIASIGLLLYSSMPLAAYGFLAAIGIAILVSGAFHWHLATWYFGKGASAENEAGT